MSLGITHQDLVEIHESQAQYARDRGDRAAALRHEVLAQGWREHITWREQMANRDHRHADPYWLSDY